MYNNDNIYASPRSVSELPMDARASFIKKTYIHVAFALLAFAGLEFLLLSMGYGTAALKLISVSKYSWLVVLGAFMAASWFSEKLARSSSSKFVQYCGLGLYVGLEAVIFLPLMAIVLQMANGMDIIKQAGVCTIALFLALTGTVLVTGKDFSFLKSFLVIGGFIALGLIVCSMIFGFTLGTVFSGAMIVLLAGVILYQTSQIIHHYNTNQYIAAALGIFSSIATMFWYFIRIFMSRD